MVIAVFLLSWFAFVYGFAILFENMYLIPLWIVVGPIPALFFVLFFLLLNFPILKYTKFTNSYKRYLTSSTAAFANHIALRLKIDVEGYENVPKDGILTLFANHKSYADPFIMMEVIKRPLTFTPKMGVYKLPLIGLWLKYLGAFPIDRTSDRNTAKAMVEAIKVVKEGMAMLIFPEGGIKDRNDIKMVAMRAGAYRVAMKAGADVLPISIQGTTDVKHRAPWRVTNIKVIIHPLKKYEDIKHLSTAELADEMFTIINNHL
ncbi:MAG TPA: hypothetical protein DDW82_08240 [Acholeplasmataceae bacterium]|nr:MAG: hypothetical protein A2Y43_01845 [Tenericutes bacterium GWA2_38_26]HBG33669.1 hypothetical protein [Acholeplasmataceae bacterium]